VALSTLEELEESYRVLTARIVALDIDIGRETDSERRKTLTERRTGLAMEREKVAADIGVLHPTYPLAVIANAPILEHRVTKLERDVQWLKASLSPDARALVARTVFYGLIAAVWSMWMIKEMRDWLITNPAQAIAISLAMIIAALIIRWLPEDRDHER
jgi:hypothetical protein